MFSQHTLDLPENLFDVMSTDIYYEDVADGRKGSVLVDKTDDLIPIVRTTTKYMRPAQQFSNIHHQIVDKIKQASGIDGLKFNNALIEIYSSKYTTMGYHSDQALDLADDSYIGIFSCYDNPKDLRTLMIKEKKGDKSFEIPLHHNSVLLFSRACNSDHLHKIILKKSTVDNHWLGITFRLSKTMIKFVDGIPYLTNGKELTLATDQEKNEFYKLRGAENKSTDFKYPEINYTISPSDTFYL